MYLLKGETEKALFDYTTIIKEGKKKKPKIKNEKLEFNPIFQTKNRTRKCPWPPRSRRLLPPQRRH